MKYKYILNNKVVYETDDYYYFSLYVRENNLINIVLTELLKKSEQYTLELATVKPNN